jgi:hypothetical protein
MKSYQQLIVIIICLAMTYTAQAENKTSLLMQKVFHAYGGKTLTNARSLTINETYKSTMVGQSETPETLNLREVTQSAIIDFEHNEAQVSQKIAQREITFYIRRIFKEQLYYSINLVNNSYGAPQKATRFQVSSYAVYINDIALARLLFDKKTAVKSLPDISIAAIAYGHLSMSTPDGKNISLYIDKSSGLIKHSMRKHPNLGDIRTDFSNIVKIGKIQYAKNTEVFYGKNLARVVLNRTVELNHKLPSDFADLSSFHQHSVDLYPSTMTVRALSEQVFLVGKGAVNSLFFVDGKNVVGVESYAGVRARFNALKKHLKRDLVLTDLVVTHHHSDHISGINELAQSNVNIVTAETHKGLLKQNITDEISDSRFITVNNSLNLAGGKIKIFDIATAHSAHNLVFYVPLEQLLFAADYYRSSYDGEKIHGFTDLVNFRHAIDQLNIKVTTFTSAHGVKLLDYQQLTNATDNTRPFNCQKYASICTSTR